jgi:hypothetical protein
MYKAFLAYEPFKDTVKAIKGYVCTCRSGLKVIGSCVHIATLIFLLSNKKYVIKKPGEYLNSIFIDTIMKWNHLINHEMLDLNDIMRHLHHLRIQFHHRIKSINNN